MEEDQEHNNKVDVNARIKTFVHEMLKEESEPILLAVVGQRLASSLSQPLREILGNQRLSDLLGELFAGDIQFVDEGSRLAVQLKSNRSSAPAPTTASRFPRYDPAFWAAFSKPLADAQARFLKATRPFHFVDLGTESTVPEGWLEIPRCRVPPVEISKPERDKLVQSEISGWCKENGLDERKFLRAESDSLDQSGLPRPPGKGRSALIQLIEAMPKEEWDKYRLSLDLIHRLLSR